MTNRAAARDPAAIAIVVAALIVLGIPGYQCLSIRCRISYLERDIARTKADNEALLKDIEALHESKLAQVVAAARDLDKLEGRLKRNQDLSESTEKAREKLKIVKMLIQEHGDIRRDLERLQRRFPELMSGL